LIKLSDYSNVLTKDIITKVEKDMTANEVMDFKGTTVLKYAHREIAKLVLKYKASIINLDQDDLDKVRYFVRLESEPHIDDMNKYKKIFKGKFKIGDIAILEEVGEVHIIIIESINDNFVRFRKYLKSKVQPIYFRERGWDSRDLYNYDSVYFDTLFRGKMLIRKPDEEEKPILELLFERVI